MPRPTEHKTVQAQILAYAQEIGWSFVTREEAERRRGFVQEDRPSSQDDTTDRKGARVFQPVDTTTDRNVRAPRKPRAPLSLFFDALLDAQVRRFNPSYTDAEGALIKNFQFLQTNIYGNRDFVNYLRNKGKFRDHGENRELDLILIDYDNPGNNVYEVTEEWAFHNGRHGTREDVVFLVNGIPVLVVECKNATKAEAIALGVDQIRRYHDETPELFVPQQVFSATDAIGFAYGATWNLVRRNVFNWKGPPGQLETKVKQFCAIPQVLAFLKDYIVFAEKDEDLNKYILRQHQTGAVEATVARALDPSRTRGLVWHTQGSGKTFTMIKAAELLFRAPEADKPTILMLIDRNELEDQMLKNLAALGVRDVKHADRISRLNQLLKDDYRGIVVTTIHRFRDMPPDLNTRSNIYALIDEAHRTTGGDLGTFLMAGLPNATLIGFTGTPIDRTAYGRGTFKTFGFEDGRGYLHKYSIAESIEDGTTLQLYYQLAPNDMLVPHDTLDKEFLSLAEAEGVADIEELNKILEKAVNLKNFLKGRDRIEKVAAFVADHYQTNVEPLGYKAFLVGVDREACALYKHALDRFLPPEYSEVVFTGSNNDPPLLKAFHLDKNQERQIRKSFGKIDQQPKILIVTEKLLTGFDAPVLYAMYLDKPMRDHTLLQAIARVNRPYENEALGMVKPHGFILDFVGLFDKLEKALAFDSDEVNAIVKDIKILKALFKTKMEGLNDKDEFPVRLDGKIATWKTSAPAEAANATAQPADDDAFMFTDKAVDRLIEHFRDPDRRKAFFKECKEIEMLYEIISPDAFLRPFIDDYATLCAIYEVVRKAYAKQVPVDRVFLKKTSELVRNHVGAIVGDLGAEGYTTIDRPTLKAIAAKHEDNATKVINLVKTIEKKAEDASEDPILIEMRDRAQAVQDAFEQRQKTTAEALEELKRIIEQDESRRAEQAKKGFDGLTFFVYRTLLDAHIPEPEAVSAKIKQAFVEHPNWTQSENAMRELRTKTTFALHAQCDDVEQVAEIVDKLFSLLERANRI
ncbi:MAG: type I restriction endonuclease subunit R [Kiritimatiellia bacterium]|jgi:type I restriction enzyme R subunit